MSILSRSDPRKLWLEASVPFATKLSTYNVLISSSKVELHCFMRPIFSVLASKYAERGIQHHDLPALTVDDDHTIDTLAW